LRDLITILDDLKQRGVKFKSLTEAIDTETPAGRRHADLGRRETEVGPSKKEVEQNNPKLQVGAIVFRKTGSWDVHPDC
jgi:hypothetical protein